MMLGVGSLTMRVPSGILADRFGRARTLAFLLALFVVQVEWHGHARVWARRGMDLRGRGRGMARHGAGVGVSVGAGVGAAWCGRGRGRGPG